MNKLGAGLLLVLLAACDTHSDAATEDAGSRGHSDGQVLPGLDAAGEENDGAARDGEVAPPAPARDAGPDAAPSEPGAADAGSDAGSEPLGFFGPSRCASAGLTFCDDFEATEIDDAKWDVVNDASLDSEHAARGDKALHLHTVDNGFAYLRHRASFPALENGYWGRTFVYLDALPTSPPWAHWTLIEASGRGDSSLIRVGGQLHGGKNENYFGVGSDVGPTGDWTWLDESKPAPTGTWVCLEWQHDAAAHVTRFFIDGVESTELATTTTDHGGNQADYDLPTFEQLWVGFWLYQGGSSPGTYDTWIDSFALDDARIGCTK